MLHWAAAMCVDSCFEFCKHFIYSLVKRYRATIYLRPGLLCILPLISVCLHVVYIS